MEITKEELENYYNTHTYKQCQEFFSISDRKLKELIKEFNIIKKTKTFEQVLNELSYDKFYELYIVENNSKSYIEKELNISDKLFTKLMKYYNIHKEKEQINELKRKSLNKMYSCDEYRNNVVEKRKSTCENLYGYSNYNNTDKARETCLNKYGVRSFTCSDEFKNKSKETCLNKYGVEFYPQSDVCKEHLKDVWNNKTEEDINSIIIKSKETKKKRYGDENYSGSPEKRKKTCIERYGVDSYSKLTEGKEKIRETCLKKYGVDFSCMRKEARMRGNNSKPNILFEELLVKNGIHCERELPLERYSYDFVVGNSVIEINPTITHNVDISPFNRCVDKNYHLNKSNVAKSHGFRCIHIFDWDNVTPIINMLGNRDTLYARKCVVESVTKKDAIDFLNKNHIQGYANDSVRIGLYYDSKLVSIMTFGKPRYNNKYEWELIRYCSSCNIVGGAKRLFSAFIKMYKVSSVISYCDMSKFNGDVYECLGFKLEKISKPSCHWFHIKDKIHITDNLLRQRGYDQLFGTSYGKGTSNTELMLSHGFVRVFDCGQARYVYTAS